MVFKTDYRLMQVKKYSRMHPKGAYHFAIFLTFIKLPIEPWHMISNNVVFQQVTTQTSLLLSLETKNDFQSVVNIHRILERSAKALIRLHLYAGWSEDLLVAHTTLLEISRRGSIVIKIFILSIFEWPFYTDFTVQTK